MVRNNKQDSNTHGVTESDTEEYEEYEVHDDRYWQKKFLKLQKIKRNLRTMP